MSPFLTASRLRVWRECRRKHALKYLLGFRPIAMADVLSYGILVHEGLEAWWGATDGDRLGHALKAMQDRGRNEYQQASAEELIRAYDAYYANDAVHYETLVAEEVFRAPLLNPETWEAHAEYQLAGKFDAIVRDRRDGRVLLVEHKTTGDNISDPTSSYWAKLAMDAQVSHYYLGAESIGLQPNDCLYDVLKRPAHKPYKATPEEKRKYKKDGSLYATQRLEDETPDEYRARVRAHIEDNPAAYFHRRSVPRLEDDLRDYLNDLWAEADAMGAANGQAPRNPDACHRFGRCSFWDVCANRWDPAEHPDLFERVADVHPELAEESNQ